MLVDSSRILPPQPGQNVTLFYRSKKYEVTPGDKTAAITPKEMGNRPAPPATTSHHSSTLGPGSHRRLTAGEISTTASGFRIKN